MTVSLVPALVYVLALVYMLASVSIPASEYIPAIACRTLTRRSKQRLDILLVSKTPTANDPLWELEELAHNGLWKEWFADMLASPEGFQPEVLGYQ